MAGRAGTSTTTAPARRAARAATRSSRPWRTRARRSRSSCTRASALDDPELVARGRRRPSGWRSATSRLRERVARPDDRADARHDAGSWSRPTGSAARWPHASRTAPTVTRPGRRPARRPWTPPSCAPSWRQARADLLDLAQGVAPARARRGGARAARCRRWPPARRCRRPSTCGLGRLRPAVESALYFVCAEALTNVAKHADAPRRWSSAARETDGWAVVRGRRRRHAAAPTRAGSGLRGLADRVEALGGELTRRQPPATAAPSCPPASRSARGASDDTAAGRGRRRLDDRARGARPTARRGRATRSWPRPTPPTALLREVVTHPDLDAVVVDIRMPPTHTDEGIAVARRLRQRYPRLGVLVLSQYLESHYATSLLTDAPEHAGYLLKDRVSDVAVLVDALRRVVEGECVVDPTIVAAADAPARDARPARPAHAARARGARPDGRGTFQRRHRRQPRHGRPHARGAHPADAAEARPAAVARRPPHGCWRCCATSRTRDGGRSRAGRSTAWAALLARSSYVAWCRGSGRNGGSVGTSVRISDRWTRQRQRRAIHGGQGRCCGPATPTTTPTSSRLARPIATSSRSAARTSGTAGPVSAASVGTDIAVPPSSRVNPTLRTIAGPAEVPASKSTVGSPGGAASDAPVTASAGRTNAVSDQTTA